MGCGQSNVTQCETVVSSTSSTSEPKPAATAVTPPPVTVTVNDPEYLRRPAGGTNPKMAANFSKPAGPMHVPSCVEERLILQGMTSYESITAALTKLQQEDPVKHFRAAFALSDQQKKTLIDENKPLFELGCESKREIRIRMSYDGMPLPLIDELGHIYLKTSTTDDFGVPHYWSHTMAELENTSLPGTGTIVYDLPEGPSVETMQALVDATFSKGVITKDREGDMPSRMVVKSIGRIENPWSFRRYARRRLEIANHRHSQGKTCKPGRTVDDLDLKELHLETDNFLDLDWNGDGDPVGPAGEAYLFHGTSAEGAKAIATFDFDVSRSCSLGLYGKAVYFAEKCSKSDEYATPDADGLCSLLICRVLLGKILYCPESAPNTTQLERDFDKGLHDSVLGDREKTSNTYREFMVYDDRQCYAEYVVKYKREF